MTGLKATRDELRHATDAAQDAAVAVVGLEHDERARHEEHETARDRREHASVSFRQLAQAGILQSSCRTTRPPIRHQASGWTFTRTLGVARALPPELLSVRSTSGEALGVEVQRGVQLLDRELAEADMSAYASRGEDDLLLVHVTEGGGEQTLGQILNTLEAEIADREQILTAEERRVFSDALVEEIADHLRYRIHEVRGRIERMNAVLRHSPTAAGKTVELPSGRRSRTMRAPSAPLWRGCAGTCGTSGRATAPSWSRFSAAGSSPRGASTPSVASPGRWPRP